MITGKDFNKILLAFFFICLFFICQGVGGFATVFLNFLGLSLDQTMSVALSLANILGISFFGFYCLVARPADLTWKTTFRGVGDARLCRRSLLSLLLAPPLIFLVNWLMEILPGLPDWVGEQNLEGLMRQPLGLLVVSIVGPVCEELLFRGGVQRSLHRAFSPKVSICCAALLFGFAHLNPAQIPAAFILGLLLGFAYWWTGSLIAPICIHILNNSLACAIGVLSPDDDSIVHLVGGTTNAGIIVLVCLFLLYILWRAVQKEGFQEV